MGGDNGSLPNDNDDSDANDGVIDVIEDDVDVDEDDTEEVEDEVDDDNNISIMDNVSCSLSWWERRGGIGGR